jgi:hypothetical protein
VKEKKLNTVHLKGVLKNPEKELTPPLVGAVFLKN